MSPSNNLVKTDLIIKSSRTVSLLEKSKDQKRPYSFIIDAAIADQVEKLYGNLPELIERMLCELLIKNIKDLNE